MTSEQGSLELLQHPVAQELLQATFPLRLAYRWTDGTPRVVPIGFHWDGADIVLGTGPDSPKIEALRADPDVAITIDTNQMPYHVLLIRGTASITIHNGIIPEYEAYTYRMMGDAGGKAWLEQAGPLFTQMARIAIRPTWVGVLDFETRLPSPVEHAIERLMSGG